MKLLQWGAGNSDARPCCAGSYVAPGRNFLLLPLVFHLVAWVASAGVAHPKAAALWWVVVKFAVDTSLAKSAVDTSFRGC